MPYPEINVMCIIIKSLIREGSILLVSKIIEFLQHNSKSVKGDQALNYLWVDEDCLKKESYNQVIGQMITMKEHMNIEINTFLLNRYNPYKINKHYSSVKF